MAERSTFSGPSRILTLASICIVVGSLYLGRDVLIPVALAILFTFLLAPLVVQLERLRIGRTASAVIVVLLGLALVGLIGWLLAGQARELATRLPEYRQSILDKLDSVRAHLGGLLRAREEIQAITADATRQGLSATQPSATNGSAVAPVPVAVVSGGAQPIGNSFLGLNSISDLTSGLSFLTPLATALIVLVFVVFMLVNREDLRDRLIRLVGAGRLTVATQAMDDAAGRVSRYLLAQLTINGSVAILASVALLLIGVPNPFLWGLLCGVLRFLPYVGIWIGAIFPILLSLVLPGWSKAALTVGMFLGLELLASNAIEPLVIGSSTGVSPIAILGAAVFWTWLWGGAGLLLSTPLTVCLAVAGKYVPHLEFLGVLLGDEPVLKPHERFYQRLLALDAEEAMELVLECLKTQTIEELYDHVLLPALALAERDFHLGDLNRSHLRFIRRSMREILEELAEKEPQAAPTPAPAAQTPAAENSGAGHGAGAPVSAPGTQLPRDRVVNVLCLPAHGESDALVALMASQLLQAQGYAVSVASSESLASEKVTAAVEKHADIVLVSALAPAAIAHSRYLCKRLRDKLPEIPIAVGLWMARSDPARVRDRVYTRRNIVIVASLAAAQSMVHQLAQPILLQQTAGAGAGT